jgi:tetratricopeptide (TPR) repeat protein
MFVWGIFALVSSAGYAQISLKSEHFEVIADSGDGEALLREMEERFSVYNRLFRFDPEEASYPLRVRSFRDREAYNSYISSRLGAARTGAVYLHYNQKERRELVVNRGSPEEGRALPYQAFIQFLRAFVANPPSWIREGFAIYFSTLNFTNDGKPAYEENLSWLDTVKNLGSALPGPEAILLADSRGLPPEFQSLAWSLVSFFLNSGNENYLRTMTDSFMVLSDGKNAAENAEAVAKRITMWNSMETLTRDYRNYLDSRKTFTELLEEGQRAYARGDALGAEVSFYTALDQRPGHYAPYYYLGLLAYEEGSYDMADQYYRSAIERGADFALVCYALGVNAASAGKKMESINYLHRAAEASPERYREKAEGLIARLR